MSADLDTARSLVAGAVRIIVLTGAGISTDSGIPDFRGPNGVWTKNPAAEKLSTLSDYLASKQIREQTWLARRDNAAWRAKPNRGHRALVDLEHAGKLSAILTQNIDGLHQRAGSDPNLVIDRRGRGPTGGWIDTARQHVCHGLPVLRRPRRHDGRAGPGGGRGERPAVPQMRRDSQVRHHFLRPGPGREGAGVGLPDGVVLRPDAGRR